MVIHKVANLASVKDFGVRAPVSPPVYDGIAKRIKASGRNPDTREFNPLYRLQIVV